MSQKRQVLQLYKRIFRIGRNWIAKAETETEKERKYIREETRNLFRQNFFLKDPKEIQQRIEEGEARLQIAQHFCKISKIPKFTNRKFFKKKTKSPKFEKKIG